MPQSSQTPTTPELVKLAWANVESVTEVALQVGDQIVTPGVGVAYFSRPDGSVSGVGWMPLEGRVWTVVSNSDGSIRARRSDGFEASVAVRIGAARLRIKAGAR